MFDSILHPTSLTALDDSAFDHSLALAVATRSALTLLHVDPKDAEDPEWERFPAVRKRLTEWHMLPEGASQAEVNARLGVQINKVESKSDNPVSSILAYQLEHRADLVVMSNGGKEGLDRWLSPSVSEPLAREAGVPSLFVPEDVRGFVDPQSGAINLRKVLVPVSADVPWWPALLLLERLLNALGAPQPEITCIHVGETFPEPSRRVDLKFEVEQISGDPVTEVVERSGSVDLLVVPTAGHQGFLDNLRGSTSEQITRKAACPLLSVPRVIEDNE